MVRNGWQLWDPVERYYSLDLSENRTLPTTRTWFYRKWMKVSRFPCFLNTPHAGQSCILFGSGGCTASNDTSGVNVRKTTRSVPRDELFRIDLLRLTKFRCCESEIIFRNFGKLLVHWPGVDVSAPITAIIMDICVQIYHIILLYL